MATGFRLPYGFEAALDLALERRAGRPIDDAVAAETAATS
jgi:hypothetical protein